MHYVTVSAMLLSIAMTAAAQAPRSFEVASIKAAPPVTMEMMHSGHSPVYTKIDNARAQFNSVTLMTLITTAYGVRTFQVSGPDWLSGSYFDVVAKLPAGSSPSQVPEMLQNLLAERFKIKVRRDNRDFPAYALTVGKDGVKLASKPADFDPSVNKDVQAISMGTLAVQLSSSDDNPVVDCTEQKDEFLLPSEHAKNLMSIRVARMRSAAATAAGQAPDPEGPNVFGFAQSIGLKLESKKLSLPYIVIERIEKTATEN